MPKHWPYCLVVAMLAMLVDAPMAVGEIPCPQPVISINGVVLGGARVYIDGQPVALPERYRCGNKSHRAHGLLALPIVSDLPGLSGIL